MRNSIRMTKGIIRTGIQAVAIAVFALMACCAPAAADERPNLAAGARVESSSLPNPLWSPAKAVDGSLGPTDGWLGEWSPGVVDNPWISFTLASRAVITDMEVMQAAFSEASEKRFLRPKKIRVDLYDGGKAQQLVFGLKDEETTFQKLSVGGIAADRIVMTVIEVYPDAKVSNMTGFQEVLIYGTPAEKKASDSGGTAAAPVQPKMPPVTAPVKPARKAAPAVVPDSGTMDAGDDVEDNGDDSGEASGSLSEEEAQILDLLRELIDRLEKKFMED